MLLARTLWREGYDDHLAGHITCNRQADGTLLCNPWLAAVGELRPEHVIRIDLDGNVRRRRLAGRRSASRCTSRCTRPGTTSTWPCTTIRGSAPCWADMRPRAAAATTRAPRWAAASVVLVDEYDGAVNDPDAARGAVATMGDADIALLANHGVFVLGRPHRAAHQRAVALEQRCQQRLARRGAGDRPVADPAVVDGDRCAPQRRQRLPRLLGSDGPPGAATPTRHLLDRAG